MRSTPREDDRFSPVQAVYGLPLTLPADHQDNSDSERPLEQVLESFRLTADRSTAMDNITQPTAGAAV